MGLKHIQNGKFIKKNTVEQENNKNISHTLQIFSKEWKKVGFDWKESFKNEMLFEFRAFF